MAAAAVLAGVGGSVWGARHVAADLDTPRDLHAIEHVGSAQCRRCHEEHYASWHRTFHRTMTQEASEASVLGDFDGAELEYLGVVARMARDGGRFRITFEGPGGRGRRTVDIARTVGSHRYQQYLAREGDLYVRLPVAWHVEEQRWFHMNGAFLTPDPEEPPPGGHVAKEDYDRHVVRWNDNCVFCHNVAPNPGWNETTESFETTVAELGIACEACHGPGAAHVARNTNPVRRYALHLGDASDPTIVSPARLSPERSAEVCGRCHGQRMAEDIAPFVSHGDPFVPGDELSQYSAPLTRDTELGGERAFAARFWPDGTPRLTAYEYQGLLMSPCEGLTCTSCHGMHEGDPAGQMRVGLEGDAMCTQCHEELESTPAAREHAAHDPSEVGCADCHMPRIVYGLVDVHRSHRIEIPDARAHVAAGRPAACTLCHVTGDGSDAPPPWAIEPDPIARAVIADALGRGVGDRGQRAGWLLHLMELDRYPAVRRVAWRGLRRLAPEVPRATFEAYEATERAADRRAAIARIEAALPFAPVRPPAESAATLAARADEVAIEIGE